MRHNERAMKIKPSLCTVCNKLGSRIQILNTYCKCLYHLPCKGFLQSLLLLRFGELLQHLSKTILSFLTLCRCMDVHNLLWEVSPNSMRLLIAVNWSFCLSLSWSMASIIFHTQRNPPEDAYWNTLGFFVCQRTLTRMSRLTIAIFSLHHLGKYSKKKNSISAPLASPRPKVFSMFVCTALCSLHSPDPSGHYKNKEVKSLKPTTCELNLQFFWLFKYET